MKMSTIRIAFAAMVAAGAVVVVRAAVPASAVEAVPNTVNYHGTLIDPATGVAYTNGSYKLEFRLYNALTGGSCLWGGTYSAYVKDGYFSVMLGDPSGNELISKPSAQYKNVELWKALWGANDTDTARYLGVTPYQTPQGRPVSSPVEIAPRQRLLTSPFAFRAERAYYAHTVESCATDFSVDGGVNCKGPLTARNTMTLQGALTANSTAKFVGAVEAKSNLSVAGKLTASAVVEAKNTLTATGAVDAKSQLAVAGTATVTGNVEVKGKITRNNVEVVPVALGGITLWSQTTAPDGEPWAANGNSGHWAICNGQTVNGLKTPDLRNLFLVGAGGNYKVGNTGGSDTVKLTVDQIPAHKHTTAVYGNGQWIDLVSHDSRWSWGEIAGGYDFHFDFESNQQGGDEPHENRPPYYAVYYIMRVR